MMQETKRGTGDIAAKQQQADSDDIPSEKSDMAAPRPSPSQKHDDTAVISSFSPAIPYSERRGLWSRLSVIAEVQNPQEEYGAGIKWTMTVIVSLAAMTSSIGTAIFYPALALVAEDLHTAPEAVNLSLAFYLLAMAITPIWWSAWSETLGRRTMYILSFSLFIVFSIVSAVSVNLGMLVTFRILSGGAAASVQSVGAGTCADIWKPEKRGRAMAIFYLGPLCGPGLAPIIGGVLAQTLGWRSTLWALVIFGGVMWLLIILCLPETSPRRPGREEKVAFVVSCRKWAVDPLKILGQLRYPPILITVYSGGLSFASLYIINTAIQTNFHNPPYNFSTLIVGLMYIAPTLGYAVASQIGGRWIDHLIQREAVKANRYDAAGKPIYLPEDRMQENIWLAASLYPMAMIWYGWTVDKHVLWIVPCIANFFFGIGSMLVFGAVTTMLTEFTPKKSSSGVALNNFVRQILATIAVIVVQPLINSMGTGWMCTMTGLFAWVTGNLTLYILRRNVTKWRTSMDERLHRSDAGT